MNKQLLRNIIFCGLFVIPFIPFLVSSSFFFPFITPKAFTWRIIVEVIFAAWVVLALAYPEYRVKRSAVLYSILAFLAVIGIADIFGMNPAMSFWSNFKRMEGYITLLHLGAFFLVISSVFDEESWKKWWNTSLSASFLMVLYSISQLLGIKAISQGGARVDGTFGNATYLAVYMLFHIFIALLFMMRDWRNKTARYLYMALIVLEVFILYHTATRGAILGLLGGLFVVAVLNLRNKEDAVARKGSRAIMAVIIVLVAGFALLKDTSFVTGSPVLNRFASISTQELKNGGRSFVWPMALKGIEDHPILGWGQENFVYIFQQYYSPEMFRLEPWFDRAHNIFLDWAVAGGILGLISYLSLYASSLYLLWRKSTSMSHGEKSVLTGLLAAYFFHNLFVFDHLISYILFFSFLSYVHYRSGGELLWQKSLSAEKAMKIMVPVVSIVLLVSLYTLNWRPLQTNLSLISALNSIRSGVFTSAPEYFEKAYTKSRLGRPEVVEQIVGNSTAVLTSSIPMEDKNNFYTFATNAIINETKAAKGLARYEMLAGSFLATTGNLSEALPHLNLAKELIPGKQQVYFELGGAYLGNGEPLKALEFFKTAYDMAPSFEDAQTAYLIGAIYANDRALESRLLAELNDRIIFDDRMISAYYINKRYSEAINLLRRRIQADPANKATYEEYIRQVETASLGQ